MFYHALVLSESYIDTHSFFISTELCYIITANSTSSKILTTSNPASVEVGIDRSSTCSFYGLYKSSAPLKGCGVGC